MSNWKLVWDDEWHCHYEAVPTGCCESWDQIKECPDCSTAEEPVRWHASFYCPICRGEGKLI